MLGLINGTSHVQVTLLQSGQIADLLAALRTEPDSRTGEPFALPDARGAAYETDPRSGR